MLTLSVSQWRNTGTIDRSIALPPFPDSGDIAIGLAAFREKEDKIELLIDSDRNVYDIACDRILSGAGFMDFLLQVHSKPWATPQHIYDLLDVITCWTYREHGKFPQLFFDVAGGANRGMDT
jgi:hypothetical protein